MSLSTCWNATVNKLMVSDFQLRMLKQHMLLDTVEVQMLKNPMVFEIFFIQSAGGFVKFIIQNV